MTGSNVTTSRTSPSMYSETVPSAIGSTSPYSSPTSEHAGIPAVVIPSGRRSTRVGMAALCLTLIGITAELVRNPNFEWPVVWQYLFEPVVLEGMSLTLLLTAVSMVVGTGIAVLLAVMRMSKRAWLRIPSTLYLWFFRGTPLLVQLIFWYNLAFLYPHLYIAVPFGPVLYDGSVNDLITPYTAAMLGLALNEGAYMAEIVRAGILSVDPGQREAARALGMTNGKILRRIVLPQALRIIIPPTGNQTISMLKTTCLVSVISLSDLLFAVQTIASRTFQTIPLLIVACVWYLALTSVMSFLQERLERHFASRTAGV